MRAHISFIIALTGLFVSGAHVNASEPISQDPNTNAYDFSFQTPYDTLLPLKDFEGRVILVVNTATECGFKDQFADLQVLHQTYSDRGLIIIGVPSNDFGGQEPRTNAEMAGYCEATHGVTFQLTAKTSVKGSDAHPFFQWAVADLGSAARPYWNFHKYLIDTEGALAAWFPTPTRPTASTITAIIEQELEHVPSHAMQQTIQ